MYQSASVSVSVSQTQSMSRSAETAVSGHHWVSRIGNIRIGIQIRTGFHFQCTKSSRPNCRNHCRMHSLSSCSSKWSKVQGVQGLSKVRSKIKDGLCFNSISVEWIDYINSMWFVTRSAWFDEKWEMTELPDQTRLWFVSYSWNSLHSTIIHLFIWLTLCRSQPCQPGLMKSDVCQDTFPAILSMAVGGGTCCNPGDKGHCSNSPANCWYWIFPMLFKVSWHHTAAVTMGSSVQNPSEMAVGKLAVAKNNR